MCLFHLEYPWGEALKGRKLEDTWIGLKANNGIGNEMKDWGTGKGKEYTESN